MSLDKLNHTDRLVEHGRPFEVAVDYERTDLVLGTLLDLYRQGEYPYNLESTQVPHARSNMSEYLPRDGVEHASFLWATCYYMRGGIKSVEAVRRLSKMYDDESSRHLFDFAEAQHSDVSEVNDALRGAGLGFRETISKLWIENAKRMIDLYDGDPRNIFSDVTHYSQALERIRNNHKGGGFIGFQEKMTSMIIHYLWDDGLIEEIKDYPIPVDIHVMRIAIENEMITFPNSDDNDDLYRDETTEALRQLYIDYVNRHDASPIDLGNAVWSYSEALCGYQPGNITLEPQGRDRRNGRSTELVPLEYDPLDDAQRNAYARTCGRCALRDTCVWNVPGKPYYVQGELRRRGPRQDYDLPPTLF